MTRGRTGRPWSQRRQTTSGVNARTELEGAHPAAALAGAASIAAFPYGADSWPALLASATRGNPSTRESGLPELARYTCPPRGPLAQLGERRPCTARGQSLPSRRKRRSDAGIGRSATPQQPPRPRVGVSSFCRIGLPVLREPRPGRSMTCVRPLAHERYDRVVRSREEAAHEGWRLSLRLIRISRGGSCEEAELRSSRLRR